MAEEGGNILAQTKQVLGLESDHNVFDLDILLHMNSVFADLHQLGVGPDQGFEVTATSKWQDFLDDAVQVSRVKGYVYLKTRMLFDPPATSFHLNSMEKQIQQMEFRLNVHRETTAWVSGYRPEEGRALDG